MALSGRRIGFTCSILGWDVAGPLALGGRRIGFTCSILGWDEVGPLALGDLLTHGSTPHVGLYQAGPLSLVTWPAGSLSRYGDDAATGSRTSMTDPDGITHADGDANTAKNQGIWLQGNFTEPDIATSGSYSNPLLGATNRPRQTTKEADPDTGLRTFPPGLPERDLPRDAFSFGWGWWGSYRRGGRGKKAGTWAA